MRDEGFQQILDPVRHYPSLGLAFLTCRIAPFQPRREHFLRRHTGLMQGNAPVWPDGVFSQLRTGTAGAVQNNKYLAALGRDLYAKAGSSRVPVDDVRFRWRQRVDSVLGQFDARHATKVPSSSATFASHR